MDRSQADSLAENKAPIVERRPDRPHRCDWSNDEDHGKWDTSCGQAFYFIDDGPTENGFRFCPYCGGTLHEETLGDYAMRRAREEHNQGGH